jgi:hypothetical protein
MPFSVIPWTHDPDLEALLQDLEISAAAIPGDWLRRSCYGEILYRHYKSGWIHALDPDSELHTENHAVLDRREHPPHHIWHDGKPAFAIPTEFILVSFERALERFEAEIPDSADVVLRSVAEPGARVSRVT